MKLTLNHHNLRSSEELDSLIKRRLSALQGDLEIEKAAVRLECRHEESPAFSVRVHLVTPGPDVFAHGRDHTIRAAINKMLADVELRIRHRSLKRTRNTRTNLQSTAGWRVARAQTRA